LYKVGVAVAQAEPAEPVVDSTRNIGPTRSVTNAISLNTQRPHARNIRQRMTSL
jgi:hypothetical protein